MSIQSSINQSLGTLGIAAGLYQQTPSYKQAQEAKQAKLRAADIDTEIAAVKGAYAKRVSEKGTNLTEEQQAAWAGERNAYLDNLLDLRRQQADYLETAQEYTESALLRGHIGAQEERRRLSAQRRAARASQLRTEQRDVVNKRIADLEAGMNALSEQYDLASEYGRQQEERAEGYRSKILEVKDLINKGGNK
nr:MAG TPA: hypothetical protein [Bacteriophage sp.]